MFGQPLFTPVVKNLLIICGLVFFAQSVYSPFINDYFALGTSVSDNFYIHQFLTNIFLHGDFQHLLFNMIGLFFFGRFLEQAMGSKNFLILFLIAGLGGSTLHFIINEMSIAPIINAYDNFNLNPTFDNFSYYINNHVDKSIYYQYDPQFMAAVDQFTNKWYLDQSSTELIASGKHYISEFYTHDFYINGKTLGASGGIMGVLAAFALLFPNLQIHIYGIIPVKAKYMAIAYAVFDLIGGIQNTDNIAHFAHLGGMLFAYILIRLIWKIPKQY